MFSSSALDLLLTCKWSGARRPYVWDANDIRYGKFAALKLGVMMKKYPKRVYSKPEFTALPPVSLVPSSSDLTRAKVVKFIFSGAEFALIPSSESKRHNQYCKTILIIPLL